MSCPSKRTAVVCVFLVAASLQAADPVDFTRDVRPLLSDACFECHGPDAGKRQGDLRLDREQDAREAGVIAPGDASASELYRRITSSDPDTKMPPPESGKQLGAEAVDILRRWLDAGAPWRRHWSFVPPKRSQLPTVQQVDWPRNALDHFVLARLEDADLQPSPAASPTTLLRRATLDLTGLPPTLDELESFLADDRPGAYERAVDRLLASPRLGERLADRWLDAARYADTNGYQTDGVRHMWRWRDWVIDAYNEGLPFDQFTIEQIAGDLLPGATLEQRIATGFNRNHRGNAEGGIIPEEYRVEYVVDRVDTTATVWLGLTLGCARCHDHKYDPFSQEEFYQIFAYFNNVPERGKAFKIGNAIPTIPAPTDEQHTRLLRLESRIETQRAAFSALAPADAQAAWEKTASPPPDDWHLDDGQVFHMSFDDGQVSAALRATKPTTPRFVTETAAKSSARGSPQAQGHAVDLDGKSYIDAGDAGKFGFFDALSIACRVSVRRDGEAGFVSRMDDNFESSGYSLHLKDGRVQASFVRRWLDDALRVETKTTLEKNTWHHVVLTYDGSRTAEGIRIYVDGQPQPLRYLVNDLNQDFMTAEPLRLGAHGTRHPLDGQLDDVRVYARALSEEEASILACEERVEDILAAAPTSRSSSAAAKLRAFFLDTGGPERLRKAHAELLRLERERAALIGSFPTTMVMQERAETRPTHVLIRGAYDRPGKRVFPQVPSALAPLPSGTENNRLGFAKWLVARDNPLTARVAVNRLWQLLFGQGLVRTVEDFGSQGELPSHPQLLDWLAVEFMTDGWDGKALLRRIVTSATYRQSSHVTPESRERDPQNRLLSRGARFRLDAAAIRDQALAASGLLVGSLGGPSVRPYQPAGIWKEVSGAEYEPDTGLGLYRRSLYTFWKRTVAPPGMMVFDASPREACVVRQTRTNTPLQALNLMNDVTYVEAARVLAQELLGDEQADDRGRLVRAFRKLTARRPSDHELEILLDALDAHRKRFRAAPEAAKALLDLGEAPVLEGPLPSELAAYTTVVGMLLNLDETVTKE